MGGKPNKGTEKDKRLKKNKKKSASIGVPTSNVKAK